MGTVFLSYSFNFSDCFFSFGRLKPILSAVRAFFETCCCRRSYCEGLRLHHALTFGQMARLGALNIADIMCFRYNYWSLSACSSGALFVTHRFVNNLLLMLISSSTPSLLSRVAVTAVPQQTSVCTDIVHLHEMGLKYYGHGVDRFREMLGQASVPPPPKPPPFSLLLFSRKCLLGRGGFVSFPRDAGAGKRVRPLVFPLSLRLLFQNNILFVEVLRCFSRQDC